MLRCWYVSSLTKVIDDRLGLMSSLLFHLQLNIEYLSAHRLWSRTADKLAIQILYWFLDGKKIALQM